MRTFAPAVTIFAVGMILILFGLAYVGCIPQGSALFFARGTVIVFSASVTLVPIYYPKHSIFTQRATHALEQIRDVRTHPEISRASIDRDERGFDELISVIEAEYVRLQRDHTPVEIGHVVGSQEQLSDYFGSEFQSGPYEIIYVETEGDRPEGVSPKTPVLRNQFPPLIIDKLSPVVLEESIIDVAHTRANRYTAGTAVIWTTVSVLLTIYPVL